MIDTIVRRARRSVDEAVQGLVSKAILAGLLLAGAIFAISALNNYLRMLWGPVMANLAIAGGFFAAALIAAIGMASRRQGESKVVASESDTPQRAQAGQAADGFDGALRSIGSRLALSPQDTELALLAAKAAVPFILPRVLKLAVRNLPAVGLAAAAVYLVRRHTPQAETPPATRTGS